ncbi:unnamed protein product [Didymodactylos carnosus]|uniref:Protein RIC1 homolog n=1 Tax=Didymodactylos carnosus TaxID=1234261 RepID=A0A813VI53_9BILA|nr:unnamed protein product [Didymodactylos carnosus]CAF3633574.1 unnamed protein product [Didymodactylos carnosus]
MYFPVGSFRVYSLPLNEPFTVNFIRATRDRLKLVVLTPTVISIWLSKATTLVSLVRRSENSIAIHGENVYAEWRIDGQKIAVSTTKGYIIYYKVSFDTPKSYLFGSSNDEDPCEYLVRINTESNFTFPMVRIKIVQDSALNVESGIEGMINLGQDLLVANSTGLLYRITWDGTILSNYTISLNTLSCSICLNSDRAFILNKTGLYAKQIEFSPLLNGIGIVFSDGTSGLIICETSRFEPNQCQCIVIQPSSEEKVWKTHCCVALNAIYQLLAFGSSRYVHNIFLRKNVAQLIYCSGQGVVYYIDELTSSLQLAYKIRLSVENFPDLIETLGSLCSMKWSPDYRVLCTLWDNGAFGVWTVFGILLYCSYSSQQSLNSMQSYGLCTVIEWGPDGYTMWIASQKQQRSTSLSSAADDASVVNSVNTSQLLLLNFLKSSVINNPHSGSIEHLVLQSEDKIHLYLSGGTVSSTNPSQQQQNDTNYGSLSTVAYDVGWQIIQVPQLYIHNNWPIKFACIDNTGQYLAVAGQHGFAHLSLLTRKWKLFGNAGQERDIRVVGGLLWWHEFIICGCTSTSDSRDEIRLYSRLTNLDNSFSNVTRLQSPIVCLNVCDDTLIAFCYDLHIMLYALERKETKPVAGAHLIKLHEISVESYVPHAVFVPFVGLTSLRTDSGNSYLLVCFHYLFATSHYMFVGLPQSKSSNYDNSPQSILLNVCGRLLLLQQEKDGSSLILQKSTKKTTLQTVNFLPPVMIAAWVEAIWTISHQNSTNPYLSNALWLCCGLQGMKNHISPMLFFDLIAVVVEEAVILGAMSEVHSYNSKTFCSITKTTQVFLNHVFQELIRKNLDFDALQIAQTCKSLPHFSHVLELLLHKVLEEEATSLQPIPDPLLPRVADFIKLFPQYLRIVSHCARKTEVALWPCLFSNSIIGDPKQLFKQCLDQNNLETASSYLIIIQNLERSEISQQFAQVLLQHSLENAKWELVADIIRFIYCIDPHDLNSNENIRTINTRLPTTTSGRVNNSLSQKSPLSPHKDALKFTYVVNLRQRTGSIVTTMATSTSTTNTSAVMTGAGVSTMTEITPSSTALTGTQSSPTSSSNSNTQQPHQIRRDAQRKTSTSDNKSPKKDSEQSSSPLSNANNNNYSSSLNSAIPPASSNFIQRTLNQHALQTISKGHLRHLGYMAANINDFDLLTWLKSHRHESALVISNYTETLKALHMEFNWPFPVSISPTVYFNPVYRDKDSTSSSNENGHSDSGIVTTDRGDDEKGISTVLSTQVSRATSKEEVDVDLTPKKTKDLLDTLSLTSEASSMPVDSELDDIINNRDIETLSQELANRGPPVCEKQLKYLYDIFLSAGCSDWAFLFSLILKSQTMISQVINSLRVTDLTTQMFGLQNGLCELETWADNECFGYKPLLQFVRNQAQQLIGQRRHLQDTATTSKLLSEDKAQDEPVLTSNHVNLNRIRTNSASDTNNLISDTDSPSLAENNYDDNHKNHSGRFSGDALISLQSLSSQNNNESEPLFSPGSVRARTISSLQESSKSSPNSLTPSPTTATQRASNDIFEHTNEQHSPKRFDIKLSSGKSVNSSDFIHTGHINSNVIGDEKPNDTTERTREKLIAVYATQKQSKSLTNSSHELITNGTNHESTQQSNCLLS